MFLLSDEEQPVGTRPYHVSSIRVWLRKDGTAIMNCELLKFRKFLNCKFQLVRLNIMSQFIRPVDKHVEDLLVLDIEALRHLSD